MITQLLPLLESMTYDELTDFIDYIQYHYQALFIEKKRRGRFKKSIRSRRSGKPTGGFPFDWSIPKTILTMTTSAQVQGLELVKSAEQEPLESAIAVAQALQRAKAPLRKGSQGNIQVKKIPYERVRLEPDGEGNLVPAFDENGIIIVDTIIGLYLYLRYWQIRGDNNKQKSRVKSIYIGGNASLRDYLDDEDYSYPYRDLAYLWMETLGACGVERTRRHIDKDTGETRILTYHVRPKSEDNPLAELERQIMACIDMSSEPPTIDHVALLRLQGRLMR